jgi:hypothetical protein
MLKDMMTYNFVEATFPFKNLTNVAGEANSVRLNFFAATFYNILPHLISTTQMCKIATHPNTVFKNLVALFHKGLELFSPAQRRRYECPPASVASNTILELSPSIFDNILCVADLARCL